MISLRFLQIDLGCCFSDAANKFDRNLRARLFVSEIVPRCCLENSYIDVALMTNRPMTDSPAKILLGFLELKNVLPDNSQEFAESIYQTICYMVSALAYSRWGVLKIREPLVALIVASNCVYRVTLSRTQSRAMGFMMAIDKANDVAAMEWILSDNIERYISDREILSLTSDSKTQGVIPFDWAPLNFGNSKWNPLSTEYNFGFLFKTSSDEVIRVKENYQLQWVIGPLPRPGVNVIVKHVNAILDIDYEAGITSVVSILRAEAAEAVLAENAILKAMLKAKLEGGNPPISKPDALPNIAPSYVSNLLGIKHPYLAITRDSAGPLIVMKDVGTPLSDVMEDPQFRQRWAQSASLRDAFFSDVGLSALNLVDKLSLCHNDIRPPNIAFDGERFCVVDFDFSRSQVMCNDLSSFSPQIKSGSSLLQRTAQLMCFSVAQIALTVFMLSGSKVYELGAVTAAVSIWEIERGTSDVDADFERWVKGKGGLLLEFVSAFRGEIAWPSALNIDYTKYFADVLSEILQ